MARYIDADALIEQMEADAEHIDNDIVQMMLYASINDVKNAPTADVVKMVRCKDCIYLRNTVAYSCDLLDFWLDDTEGFCKWGERREDGEIH